MLQLTIVTVKIGTSVYLLKELKMKYYLIILFILCPSFSFARPDDFAKKLCKEQPKIYTCIKPTFPKKSKVETWEYFFHNNAYLLKTINRRNTPVWKGHTIATPIKFPYDDIKTYSPFPLESAWAVNVKKIVVDLKVLAWGAYENGRLAAWGAANGGSKICKETGKMTCKTHPGIWKVIRKAKTRVTKSQLYPVECSNKRKCGFSMYHYVQFHNDGTGLHGARNLPGANLSHGCVRMMERDSKWIHRFVDKNTLIEIKDY